MKLVTDPLRVIAHVVVLKKEEEPAPEAAVAAEDSAGRARSHQEGQEGSKKAKGSRGSRAKGREDREEEVAASSAAGGRFAGINMRLIVGLGNPGPEYEWTPHNLGFLAVDGLAERAGIRVTRPEAKSLRRPRRSSRGRKWFWPSRRR